MNEIRARGAANTNIYDRCYSTVLKCPPKEAVGDPEKQSFHIVHFRFNGRKMGRLYVVMFSGGDIYGNEEAQQDLIVLAMGNEIMEKVTQNVVINPMITSTRTRYYGGSDR